MDTLEDSSQLLCSCCLERTSGRKIDTTIVLAKTGVSTAVVRMMTLNNVVCWVHMLAQSDKLEKSRDNKGHLQYSLEVVILQPMISTCSILKRILSRLVIVKPLLSHDSPKCGQAAECDAGIGGCLHPDGQRRIFRERRQTVDIIYSI